jgi:HPt (histidine-containing phosphotransfer) domain-containing protein
MTGPSPNSPLGSALDLIWARFLPQMIERVATIEAAAYALQTGALAPEHIAGAAAEAHKLAGVLGSFGLTQGTDLARDFERIFIRDGGPEPSMAPRLIANAAQLRALIESHK